MCPSTDPIGSGFIRSFARPGGNITGVANQFGDLVPKAVEFIHSIIPGAKNLGVLMSSNPTHAGLYEVAREAAKSFGLTTFRALALSPAELDRAFQDMLENQCDSAFVLADTPRPTIVPLAAKHRIPTFYQFSLFVDSGGLASYGANVEAMLGKGAQYVDKIIRGADPAGLPVEQPTTFELVLNLKTARSLGLSIPDSIVFRADRIVE